MKIIHVVGARPNFMKMAPVFNAIKKYKIQQKIVHTGQHYSDNMSEIFFQELKIKKPDVNLHIGSASHANQVANIMIEFEKVILKEKPNLVIVYGDINSTMATSLVCAKLGIKIAHVEAGLRSGDLSMPEEINRIVTDRLSSIFFTPSKDANSNLIKEGVKKNNIKFVGNVMIDTLINFLPQITKNQSILKKYKQYGVVTLHRPSNVDNQKQLKKIIEKINEVSKKITLIFPVHPRTQQKLNKIKNTKVNKNIIITDPLGYLEFLNLIYYCKFVITDSGGIQEETTYLKIPCLTLRPNTERPITIKLGSNTLINENFNFLTKKIDEILKNKYKKSEKPKYWDGKASKRIAKIINKLKK